EALRREAQFFARRLVDALDLVDRSQELVRHAQIGLANGVEDRVLAPFGSGKASILALLLFRRRSGHAAEHLAPGLEPLRPGLRARAHQRHRVGRRGALLPAESARARRPTGKWLGLLHGFGRETQQRLV